MVYEPISARSDRRDSGTLDRAGDAGGGGHSGSAASSGAAGDSGTSAVAAGGAGQGGALEPPEVDAADGGGAAIIEGGETGTPLTCAGYALEFDGISSYAVIARVVQDDFTLEAWVKTSAAALAGTSIWE